MYIISMPLVGLKVMNCQHRVRYGTVYYGPAKPMKSEVFTLVLIHDGEMEVRKDGRTILASKSRALLWEPGEPIVMKARPSAPSYYVLGFIPYTDSGKAPTLKELGLEPFVPVRNPEESVGILDKIARLSVGRDGNKLTKCALLGLELFLALKPAPHSSWDVPGIPDSRDPDERVNDAVAYIHNNYKKRIPLKTLADTASMHPVNFIGTFRKATGLTPHRYLLDLKIEKAKDFLLLYRESPVVTALELGFHDYAHFSRAFKRRTGMGPREYRNKYKSP